MAAPRCGTLSGYRAHKKRGEPYCTDCRAAMAAYSRAYRHAQKVGPTTDLVDAGPARAHLHRLMAAGMSAAGVAAMIGAPIATVEGIARARTGASACGHTGDRVQQVTADAILSAPTPTYADLVAWSPEKWPIPSFGARRRLHALACNGWPPTVIMRRAGIGERTAHRILNEPKVHARSVRGMQAIYEELSMTAPAPGVDVYGRHISIAKAKARRAGYAPALAWDDIDDPDAEPQGVADPARDGGWLDLDELVHLLRGGVYLETAADRVGVSIRGIEKAARRHGRGDVLTLMGISTSIGLAA